MMEKILVVIDMQKDFISGALKNEDAMKIVPYVKEKIEDAKAKGWNVLFTKDTHEDDYMETEEGKHLPVPHCIRNTDGWNIIDELEADKFADEVIEKETFGSTALAEVFMKQKENIKEVEFIGVCTDICVISNVLMAKAILPNKKIRVDAAGCAGVTPQSHDTAISAMEACHIEVKNKEKEAWR